MPTNETEDKVLLETLLKGTQESKFSSLDALDKQHGPCVAISNVSMHSPMGTLQEPTFIAQKI